MRDRLRLVTLNCSSLSSELNLQQFQLFVRRSASCSILFLQETRLTAAEWEQVASLFPDWTVISNPSYRSARGQDGGVAIFLRKSIFSSDPLLIWSDSQDSFPNFPGRVLRLQCSSDGLSLDLLNVYFPSGDPKSQCSLISSLKAAFEQCRPVLDSANSLFIMGGDFNFVHDPTLDRSRSASSSDPTGAFFLRELSSLCLTDVYRRDNPNGTAFTHFSASHKSGSRLDRFYTSGPLTPCVDSFLLSTSFSDHRPVFLNVPLPEKRSGPPIHRVRTHFFTDPNCVALFESWLQTELRRAPLSPSLLLSWWPGLKRRLRKQCAYLNSLSRSKNNANGPGIPFPNPAPLLERIDHGDFSALDDFFIQLRTHSTEQRRQAHARFVQRRDYLKRGEAPNRYFSSRFGTQAKSFIPSLKTRDGPLTTDPAEMATIAVSHFAQIATTSISEAPADDDPVLRAVKQGPQCPASAQAALSLSTVQESEVSKALARMPPGKAPGPDGIPIEIYRRFRTLFTPILARYFSAILSLERAPTSFNLGDVIFLHKSKSESASDPNNYRPITLLNSDYKLLAKVLSNRILAPLASVVGPEQSAYLPGRQLGDAVLLLQSIDTLLSTLKRSALLVACDFAKAYDTISRPFLFSVMSASGFGAIVPYVKILLADTRARGIVNGVRSPNTALFSAGVRQGCPLSPTLYLFVAHALSRFLTHRGLGVTLPLAPLTSDSNRTLPSQLIDTRLPSLQFADDTYGLLHGPLALPNFISTMDHFASISGQRLNSSKTQLVGLGTKKFSSPIPPEPFKLVSSITHLGVPFHSKPDWSGLLSKAQDRIDHISKWGLSELGRAHAVSAYVYPLFLSIAEFSPLPPKTTFLDKISSSVSKLLDRDGLGKSPRLKLDYFCLPASQGGFGLTPLTSAITARHASWAVRFFLRPHLPWARIWLTLILMADASAHPVWLLPCSPRRDSLLAKMPEPLKRCFTALYATIPSTSMQLKDSDQLSAQYCRKFKVSPFAGTPPALSLPFENPWMSIPTDILEADRDLSVQFRELKTTINQKYFPFFNMLHLAQMEFLYPGPLTQPPFAPDFPEPWRLSAPSFSTALVAYLKNERPYYDKYSIKRPLLLTFIRDSAQTQPVFAKILTFGANLIRSSEPCPPTPTAFEGLLTLYPYCPITLPFLRCPVPFDRLSIGQLTAIHFQLSTSHHEALQGRLDCFMDLAFAHSQPRPSNDTMIILRSHFRATWRRLLSVKWDNRVLSLYWRFVLRGISTDDQRASWNPPQPLYCICCEPQCRRPRDHSFWTCPIAQAVRDALSDLLRSAGVFTPFTQHHLWLLISPDPERLPPYFWSILCCITISSMELGRRLVARKSMGKSQLSVPEISASVRSKFSALITDFRRFARIPGRLRRRLDERTFDSLFPAFGPMDDGNWPDDLAPDPAPDHDHD